MQLFIVFLCGLLLSVTKGYTYVDEENLRSVLFAGYNNDIRPETPCKVDVTLTLMSLNYLDIGAQEMCVNLVVVSHWTDSRLSWSPTSHNNISTLVVRYDTVWLPTLVIENSVDNSGLIGEDEKAPHRINHDGVVEWISPALAKVACNMRVAFFPFDVQTCSLVVYGWAHDVKEMNLTTSLGWFFTHYRENGEWHLKSSSVEENLVTDGFSTFKSLNFRITFKRKWVFLFLSLIMPAILNSILICAVFYVPFDGTDKLGYSLTVLLSYYVLLTLVSDSLPPISTDISLLQIYLTFVMCSGTSATLLSVWTVVIYKFEQSKPIPSWLVYLYNNVISIMICRFRICQQISVCFICCDKKTKVQDLPGDTQSSSFPISNSSSVTVPYYKTSPGRSIPSLTSSSSFTPKPKSVTTKDCNNCPFYQSDSNLTDCPRNLKDTKEDEVLENINSAEPITEIGHVDVITSLVNEKEAQSNDEVIQEQSSPENRFERNAKIIDGTSKCCEEYSHELTWQIVAETLDALFLRLIGGSIGILTFIVTVIFMANY